METTNIYFSEDRVEHYPISVKLEDVPHVQISGLSCSEEGILFLADKGRSLVYRFDVSDGTSYSFGKGKLSKTIQFFLVYWAVH